jgi:hypothetical protein
VHLIIQIGEAQPTSFRTQVPATSFMEAWAHALKELGRTVIGDYRVLSYGSCYRVIDPAQSVDTGLQRPHPL